MNVRKSITVRRPVETTFEAFTAGFGRWWPLQAFSYGGDRSKEIYLEGRVGGRFYERLTDGQEITIGTVTIFDAPKRVAFTWEQSDWAAPTVVDVTFTAVPEGTMVELEHRGWEEAGAGPAAAHFGQGWEFILGRFAEVAQG